MTSRQQWGIVGLVVAVLGAGLATASYVMRDELFPVEQGSTAPSFRAKVLGDTTYRSFADYKGKVLVLNIWATYCEPCKIEMPSLEKLEQQYGNKGLKIVAVEIDPGVTDDSIRTYAKNLGITFEILHDRTHEVERVYQTTGYPETFVIGPEGTIRKKWIGPDNWTSMGNRALIAQLLGLPTPRPAAEVGQR
ncbi:MAG: TlpA family protein disulfide reductase [Gemmatimonadaceae bacterium]